MQAAKAHPPQGALVQSDGSVVWRVWTPFSTSVSLVLLSSEQRRVIGMEAEGRDYFVQREPHIAEGQRYVFRLADGQEYPDPRVALAA